MARRKKRHEEEGNHEGWAIPYGDLVTLLLAFFVVMYSISSVNEGKYRVLSDSLISAFRAPAQAMEPIQIGKPARERESSRVSLIERPTFIESPVVVNITQDSEGRDQASLFPMLGEMIGQERMESIARIADEIREALHDLMDEGLVSVNYNELWLEVDIKDSILFPSGSAHLQPGAVPVLKKVVDILQDFPNPIRIEGFTDNVPIETLLYPSNWELSTARASSVVRLFNREGIEPERLSALGHGEYRPIASNHTSAGRAQNRRVVLVVLADSRLSHLMDGGLRDSVTMAHP